MDNSWTFFALVFFTVDVHRNAIGFVDSFSRYQKRFFSLKTIDEAIEKFQEFLADIGKPVTLFCDGAANSFQTI